MTNPTSEAQPAPTSPQPSGPVASRSGALGRTALCMALVALALSTVCAAFVGVVLIEAQQLSDGTWTGMSPEIRTRASVLLSSQAACALLGLAALVVGVIALLRRRGPNAARAAIAVAACGPLVSWATWSVASNVAA